MGIIGTLVFLLLFIIFIFTLRGFVIFSGGLIRSELKYKELFYFLVGMVSFIVVFNLTIENHDALGIEVTCANSAPDCAVQPRN